MTTLVLEIVQGTCSQRYVNSFFSVARVTVRLETVTALGIPTRKPYAGPHFPIRLIDGFFRSAAAFSDLSRMVLCYFACVRQVHIRREYDVQSMLSILKIFLPSSLIAVIYLYSDLYIIII